MSRKKPSPELIDLPENALEAIKSRIGTSTLPEEDKKIILPVLTGYSWLQRQLKHTKISTLRLKNLSGFSTEKRKKHREQEVLTGIGSLSDVRELQENQSLDALQGPEREAAEKK